ncbi:unnamed protein product [Sphenostylis stenocarpa]|uniref:Uncharacterized protein n=1 Tax=Sphenostylis stenocarpa TaxID=92480 RepID=A0AA86TQN7_9FABA|nr:unnamed protein product [Sphenostylis stenocarpa]
MVHDHLHSLPPVKQEKGVMTNNSVTGFPDDGLLGPHSSLVPSPNESSQGNHFNVPSPERSHWSMPNCEAWRHPYNTHAETHYPFSSPQLDPLFTLESAQNQQFRDGAPVTKQSPPLQVMERVENPTTSPDYRFPSHVFDRNKSKSTNQWSNASNESLFSIHMGNTSFSSDIGWMSKSREMDKFVDMNASDASVQGNLPALPSQPLSPATKFNDINQCTAKQCDGSKLTELKAAETMREVIMESSIKRASLRDGDLTNLAGETNGRSNLHSHSRHSDASTTSFAFNVSDGDKTISRKHDEEKEKQQSPEATPDAVQTPKQTTDSPQNKSPSCFSCC